MLRRQVIAAAGGVAAAALFPAAKAQGRFPSRPIKLLVSSPPGSAFDNIARAAAVEAEKKLGQPLIMDYRPGAGGVPAFVGAKNATPDGHTLVMLSLSTIRQPIQQDVGYDALKDFTWIASLAEINFGVVVPADSPFKTWSEFLTWSKANPSKVTYGCPSGLGNSAHLFVSEIAEREKANWLPVPYKGSNDTMVALLSGQLTFAMDTLISAAPQVKAGKVRMLALATPERMKIFPGVPTTRELGYELLIESPVGIGAPANVSPAIVQTIQEAFKFAVAQPSFHSTMEQGALRAWYMSHTEFQQFAQRADREQRALLGKYGYAKKS